MGVVRFILKTLGYIVFVSVFIIAGLYFFREEISEYREGKFNALSQGIHDYEIAGYHFKVPGAYLSPTRRFRPGKVRALWLEGQMPDLSPRINDPDYNINNTDPSRIRFKIIGDTIVKPIRDFLPVDQVASTRLILENGWVRYQDDLGFQYYKNLETLGASRMRCDFSERVPNPLCEVIFNLNDDLIVNIGFGLSRWNDWEEIEDKIRMKINEFYIDVKD